MRSVTYSHTTCVGAMAVRGKPLPQISYLCHPHPPTPLLTASLHQTVGAWSARVPTCDMRVKAFPHTCKEFCNSLCISSSSRFRVTTPHESAFLTGATCDGNGVYTVQAECELRVIERQQPIQQHQRGGGTQGEILDRPMLQQIGRGTGSGLADICLTIQTRTTKSFGRGCRYFSSGRVGGSIRI